LGHFAETDPFESDETVLAFERGLRDAARPVVIHRYAGTGHWFAEPSRDAWRPEAAKLAFERTVAFLHQHLEPARLAD
jgi:carboxymethylenebutenolidase